MWQYSITTHFGTINVLACIASTIHARVSLFLVVHIIACSNLHVYVHATVYSFLTISQSYITITMRDLTVELVILFRLYKVWFQQQNWELSMWCLSHGTDTSTYLHSVLIRSVKDVPFTPYSLFPTTKSISSYHLFPIFLA